MADHQLIGDNAPDGAAPNIVEAKVWAATIASAFAGAVVAILNAVQDSPGLLAGLPTWAQSAILLLVPVVLTFVSGYLKTSNRV